MENIAPSTTRAYRLSLCTIVSTLPSATQIYPGLPCSSASSTAANTACRENSYLMLKYFSIIFRPSLPISIKPVRKDTQFNNLSKVEEVSPTTSSKTHLRTSKAPRLILRKEIIGILATVLSFHQDSLHNQIVDVTKGGSLRSFTDFCPLHTCEFALKSVP